MGRIIAIDIGKKRSGIAVTDPLKIIANGLQTVPTSTLVDFIVDYSAKENIEVIVIGFPKQMNNQPSEAVLYINPIINRLKKVVSNIPIELVDERFTSKLAFQSMIDGGVKKSDRRNKELVDTISATIILQSYLESLNLKRLRND